MGTWRTDSIRGVWAKVWVRRPSFWAPVRSSFTFNTDFVKDAWGALTDEGWGVG